MRSILFAMIVVIGVSCTTQETQVVVETPTVDTTTTDSVAVDTTTAE